MRDAAEQRFNQLSVNDSDKDFEAACDRLKSCELLLNAIIKENNKKLPQ